MKSAEEWRDDAKNWPGLSGWIMAIQADALLHAATIHMDHMPSEHWACQKAMLAEAERIKKGSQAE